MTVRIKGQRALSRRINDMVSAVEAGVERAELEETEELASDIADDAPVDTGNLQESVEAQEDGVHVTAEYSGIVEAEQPYVRPAVNRKRKRYAKRVAKEIRKEL